MSDTNENEVKKKVKRPKSQTAYPWFDLQTVMAIAQTIERIGVNGEISSATLARELGIPHGSGAWRLRIKACELFNLIEEENDTVSLKELAKRILNPSDPNDKNLAKAEAFRSVELFRGVMDELGEGVSIPQASGLDDMLKRKFGIVENRIKNARELLLRSARQAGIIESKGDRQYLVMPQAEQKGKDEQQGGDDRLREPPPPPPAFAQRTVLELRLTDVELDSLDEDDIKKLYAAVADFEATRRKAVKRINNQTEANTLNK
jgi:hypothetical protein